jgi:aspartate kinase
MTSIVVQKYGGTSVGSIERIHAVANRIAQKQREGKKLAVVVSAMAGETDRLLQLAKQIAPGAMGREVDALTATGEQASAALLALALSSKGVASISLQGHQIPIRTDGNFGSALIQSVAPQRIHRHLAEGKVVVVTGFQGVTDTDDVTTLGRGGSDLTAVALAAALEADQCEIFTDVPGVFTADPQVCGDARLIERISHDEMLELASLGAKVLQTRSVQLAKRYVIPIWVGSSFDEGAGTWVTKEEPSMEGTIVSGISCDRKDAQISVRHLPDPTQSMTQLFSALADAQVVVDVIVQDRSADGKTNLTFTVPRESYSAAMKVVNQRVKGVPGVQVLPHEKVAKISAVGIGMRTHSGVAAKMFQCLAKEKIEVMAVSTSEIKISCVIDEKYSELAVRALHEQFGLAKEPH